MTPERIAELRKLCEDFKGHNVEESSLHEDLGWLARLARPLEELLDEVDRLQGWETHLRTCLYDILPLAKEHNCYYTNPDGQCLDCEACEDAEAALNARGRVAPATKEAEDDRG